MNRAVNDALAMRDAIRDCGRASLKLWHEESGPAGIILRGGQSMTTPLSNRELERKLRKTAEPNPATLEMVVSLHKFDMSQVRFIGVRATATARLARPTSDFEVHFATFAAAMSLVTASARTSPAKCRH